MRWPFCRVGGAARLLLSTIANNEEQSVSIRLRPLERRQLAIAGASRGSARAPARRGEALAKDVSRICGKGSSQGGEPPLHP
jgi:hypothetical protein